MADEVKSMASTAKKEIEAQTDDWRTRVFMIGGAIGAVVGILTAFLYVRTAEESHGGKQPSSPQTIDTVKLGASIITIARTVAEWGRK